MFRINCINNRVKEPSGNDLEIQKHDSLCRSLVLPKAEKAKLIHNLKRKTKHTLLVLDRALYQTAQQSRPEPLEETILEQALGPNTDFDRYPLQYYFDTYTLDPKPGDIIKRQRNRKITHQSDL